MSIHLIGQGEQARELRILGKNVNNQTGFYHKRINAPDWNFYSIPSNIRVYKSIQPFCRLEPLQKNYDGYIIYEGIEIRLRLLGFHPFNTAAEPSNIELTHGIEVMNMKLYSQDGWNFHYLPSDHEDLVGTSDGVAKVLLGTIVIDDNTYDCAAPHGFLAHVVRELFLPYNKKQNAMRIIADNETVKIKTKNRNFGLFFSRKLSQNELMSSFYMRVALNPVLLDIEPRSALECEAIIQQCENAINYLRNEHHEVSKKHLMFFTGYKIASGVRKVLKPFSILYAALTIKEEGLPKGVMGVRAINDIKFLFHDSAEICLNVGLGRNNGYEMAITILENRLEVLYRLLSQSQQIRPN